jgi:hypothetical protein
MGPTFFLDQLSQAQEKPTPLLSIPSDAHKERNIPNTWRLVLI